VPEVFICDYVRTPIGRHGGALSMVRPDDLAAVPIAALLARAPDLNPAAVEEVWMGCANQAGEDNRNVARMALLLAGMPAQVPGVTLNRLCASGLEAVITAARTIRCGEMDLAIAGGVESMSRAPFVMLKSEAAFSRTVAMEDTTIGWRFVNPRMKSAHGVDSMPETAENVAMNFKISREDQDRFALRSQKLVAAAMANGRFEREIVPVTAPVGRNQTVEVTKDEHPRADTSAEGLARLRPVVLAQGSVTAGNSSGVNDGAAALLLASEGAVKRHGLVPLARIVGGASAGVAPSIMGYGPVPAVQKLMALNGLGLGDIDLFEVNEAFASQVLACLRGLGIDEDHPGLNPNGGAIALGHPLGMSGARIAGSAAIDLGLRNARRAVVSMCVGVGQGVAMLIEHP
jgi:3-oxoadipyl-CoA thiolase